MPKIKDFWTYVYRCDLFWFQVVILSKSGAIIDAVSVLAAAFIPKSPSFVKKLEFSQEVVRQINCFMNKTALSNKAELWATSHFAVHTLAARGQSLLLKQLKEVSISSIHPSSSGYPGSGRGGSNLFVLMKYMSWLSWMKVFLQGICLNWS